MSSLPDRERWITAWLAERAQEFPAGMPEDAKKAAAARAYDLCLLREIEEEKQEITILFLDYERATDGGASDADTPDAGGPPTMEAVYPGAVDQLRAEREAVHPGTADQLRAEREVVYPGTADQLRAEMQYFFDRHDGGYNGEGGWLLSEVRQTAPDGKDITPGTVAMWSVRLWGQSGHIASIRAYEKRPGRTLVRFRDGHNPNPKRGPLHPKPIGALFRQLVDELVAGWQREDMIDFRQAIEKVYGRSGNDVRPDEADRGRGPTERTRIRGEAFKRLKEEHPTWSQAKVAMEAVKELGEEVTADTVRNTYRLLGWKWERADRIR